MSSNFRFFLIAVVVVSCLSIFIHKIKPFDTFTSFFEAPSSFYSCGNVSNLKIYRSYDDFRAGKYFFSSSENRSWKLFSMENINLFVEFDMNLNIENLLNIQTTAPHLTVTKHFISDNQSNLFSMDRRYHNKYVSCDDIIIANYKYLNRRVYHKPPLNYGQRVFPVSLKLPHINHLKNDSRAIITLMIDDYIDKKIDGRIYGELIQNSDYLQWLRGVKNHSE